MRLRISRKDYVEAGGNVAEFHHKYLKGDKVPMAILNIIQERYHGPGFIALVEPDLEEENLVVDIR